jgi:hypothetical protein
MILANHGIISSSGGMNPLTVGLVSAYNAENTSNDTYGGYNGTAIGGLTYTAGKFGDAFQFNGTNSYVSIPNTINHLNFTNDFSVSLWVNYNSLSAPYEMFLMNYKDGGTYGYGWTLYADSENLLMDMRNGNTLNSYAKSFNPTTNTWYNIVATRKRSTETQLYVNGILQSGSYQFSNPTVNQDYLTGQVYNIGANNGNNLSNIKIDEVNIWNRVLTQSEITELQTKYYPF